MSLKELSAILLGTSTVTREPEVGALVLLTGGDHAGERAFIQNIAVSPYWDEEKRGVWRVYVYPENWDTGARWTDWVRLDEVEVIG